MRYKRLFILIIVLSLIYGVNRWNDYREMDLVDLLDSNNIEKIYFKQRPLKDVMTAYNRQLTDDGSIQELINLCINIK